MMAGEIILLKGFYTMIFLDKFNQFPNNGKKNELFLDPNFSHH